MRESEKSGGGALQKLQIAKELFFSKMWLYLYNVR